MLDPLVTVNKLESLEKLIPENEALKRENESLRIVARFMYLTLGFYSTPYNYRQKIGYPDGSWRTNIMEDEGHDARTAGKLAEKYFTGDQFRAFPGPHPEKYKPCWDEAKVYGQELCDQHNLGKL